MDINAHIIRGMVFPAMEALKGNRIRRNLQYLRETQHQSPDALHQLQSDALKNLLTHCVEKVPAYQHFRHLLSSIENDPLSALQQFPILTKKSFMENAEQYFTEGVDKQSLISARTGGSTGEPVLFYIDRTTVEFYEAARWRGLSWWDIHIGDRSVMIWGSPIELNEKQKAKYRVKERLLKNRTILSAYDINPESIRSHVEFLHQYRPSYIYGYASALHLFARLMLKEGLQLHIPLKGIVSTSETLYDFQRVDIEKAFGAKTVNEYGARDGGIIAYQCPHGKMHITAENAIIEIVDMHTGQPVEPGKSGLVLVTDLHNKVMPRLRYQVGDVAALSASPCGCGIHLPVMEEIQGREDDTFVSTSGRLIHGHFFNHIARNLNGIKQFQIIQHTPTELSLKIIKDIAYDEKELEHFKAEILKAMGEVTLRVEFVDSIPLSASGKIRYAKREFPLQV